MRKTSGILAMALMLGAMSGMSMDIPRTSTSRQLSFRERTLRWFLGLKGTKRKTSFIILSKTILTTLN